MSIAYKECKHEREMGKITKQHVSPYTAEHGSRQHLWSQHRKRTRQRWFVVLFSIALLLTWLWGSWLAMAQPAKQFVNQAGFDYTDQATGLSFSGVSEDLQAELQLAGPLERVSVQIVKAGDRAAAEPGDTVVYRISVRSLSSGPLQNLRVTDTLPLGFSYVEGSARAEFSGATVPVTVSRVDRSLTFQFSNLVLPASTVAQNSVVNLAYAATLSADALRGTGTNSASVEGVRADNQLAVRDGPVFYRLRVQEGILSICGTIIGRVFVDKNFDGEQQPGEPGVPNAVIFMDDGNRITTDTNGLFSVANVIAGYRTGVLDLTSLPGYTLAPNLYFIERNSQSRLVHLEPGGLVRMNFAVTPAFKEEGRS